MNIGKITKTQTTANQYINKVWQNYSPEKRLEMQKLLKRDGETFKEVNKFETTMIANMWANMKKKAGLE